MAARTTAAKRTAPKQQQPELPLRKRTWSGRFHVFAKHTAHATGRAGTFVIAVLIILAWAVTGPLFGFSDTWQLVINTGTTIVTFLMVFLIQNTQNRDAETTQLKLDELIRAVRGAKNALLDLERFDDDELERMRLSYEKLAETTRNELGRRRHPTKRRK